MRKVNVKSWSILLCHISCIASIKILFKATFGIVIMLLIVWEYLISVYYFLNAPSTLLVCILSTIFQARSLSQLMPMTHWQQIKVA